jgi:hypothetical protein
MAKARIAEDWRRLDYQIAWQMRIQHPEAAEILPPPESVESMPFAFEEAKREIPGLASQSDKAIRSANILAFVRAANRR